MSAETTDTCSCPDMRLLKKLKELIAVYHTTEKSLDYYSRALHVSSYYLDKTSRTYYGKSVYTLVLEQQIEQSKYLLCSTTMTVKEIGYRVGYDDQSFFGRFFKRMTGATPRTYRKTAPETLGYKKS